MLQRVCKESYRVQTKLIVRHKVSNLRQIVYLDERLEVEGQLEC